MGTADARSAVPQDTRQAVPSRGKGPHLIEDLGRLAGGSAVDGPLGLLAVERERLAVPRSPQHAGSPQPAATANEGTQLGPSRDVTGLTKRDPDGAINPQIGGSPTLISDGERGTVRALGPGGAQAAAAGSS
jgi:hypothetical protein